MEVLEAITARRVVVTAVTATATALVIKNGINNYDKNSNIAAQDNTRVQLNIVDPLTVTKTPTTTPKAPAMVEGRGDNHLKPDTEAGGDHSTFRMDKDGKITNTAYSVGLCTLSLLLAMIDVFYGQIELVFVMLPCSAVFRASVG